MCCMTVQCLLLIGAYFDCDFIALLHKMSTVYLICERLGADQEQWFRISNPVNILFFFNSPQPTIFGTFTNERALFDNRPVSHLNMNFDFFM